jgi:hypothetical protein
MLLIRIIKVILWFSFLIIPALVVVVGIDLIVPATRAYHFGLLIGIVLGATHRMTQKAYEDFADWLGLNRPIDHH